MLIWINRWQLQFPVAPNQKLPLLLSLYGLAPWLLWLLVRFSPLLTWADYGLSWRFSLLSSMALGFTVGLAGIALLWAIKRSLGWLSWQGPTAPSATVPAVAAIALLALAISAVEEAVFRGFVVHQLQLAYSWGWVVVLASALFAVLHLVWDGAAGLPQQPGLWLMGAVLLLARWADGGQLGLAIGLHAGWIFALALADTLTLIKPAAGAPRWLAGKADQPLTGLLDLGLLLAIALLLRSYAATSLS